MIANWFDTLLSCVDRDQFLFFFSCDTAGRAVYWIMLRLIEGLAPKKTDNNNSLNNVSKEQKGTKT